MTDVPPAERPVPHISDAELAAFIDNSLPERQRSSISAHLATCVECRAELVSTSGTVAAIPSRNRQRRAVALGAMAAAAAVLAVLWLPQTRYLDDGALERTVDPSRSISVASPADGALVDPDNLVLSWGGEQDASYRITITDASGATLWTTITTEPHAQVPAGEVPADNNTFYWYVDALRADGTSVSSGPRSFIAVRR